MRIFDHDIDTAEQIIDWIEHAIRVQRASENDEMGILSSETLGLVRALVQESASEIESKPVTESIHRLMEWHGALESAFITDGRPSSTLGVGR